MNWRRRIFEIVEPDKGDSIASRAFDWVITSLILLSVVIVFIGTFDLSDATLKVLSVSEGVASIVFTVEYCLRILTADFSYPEHGVVRSRIRYIISPMAVVDFIAILPFWLPMFVPGTMLGVRALRLVRLLRIFKLNRYFDAMKAIGEVIVAKKRELIGSLFFVTILMLISSLLMYSAEHDAQPDVFRNAFSGLWWAVATLTTVGYGDIYPVTPIGRFVGAFIAFSGLAAVAIPTGIITSGLSERIAKKSSSNSETDADVVTLVRLQNKKLESIARKLDSVLKQNTD